MTENNWTIEQIANATLISVKRLKKYQTDLAAASNTNDDMLRRLYGGVAQRVARKLTDPELQTKRRAQQKCPACYFIPVFAGDAMTTSTCQNCGTKILNGSTDADVLCMDCAKELHCCRNCGGQLQ